MKSEKKPIKKTSIPGWLFVMAVVMYDELILHFWTAQAIVPGRLLAVVLFALAFGGLLGFVTSLFPPRGQKWCAVIISVLLAVLYLLEYFLNDAYQNFMPFVTIFAGAEGVATDYFELIMSLLARNLWRIALVLLPAALYAIFARCKKTGWKLRAGLAAGAAALYLLGFCTVRWAAIDENRLSGAYNFDSAVRAFGLNMGLTLDALNNSSAAEEQPSFVSTETLPPQTEPAETQTGTEATEEAPTEPIVYGDNVLDLDFAALAESEKNRTIASIHSYVASQTPSRQNEYTGLFEGKNLILITAEAFTAEVIDPERTPTLYRLATEGIRFTDYYQPAWGASTTSGEYSNLIGLVPTGGGSCMFETIQQDLFLTMGNQLQKLGYYSTAYHNHLHDFYSRHLTHTSLGYDQFIARGTGMEDYITKVFPESDVEMMEFSVEQYIDQQPFSIYYMSVSGHSVYSQESNAMSRKNYGVVAELDDSEPVKCYLAAQMEFEYAMEYLVNALEEAGIADDTVIVIATDHYPYGLEKSSTWGNSRGYLSELFGTACSDNFVRDHSALIIWSGCIEDKDIVVDTPVYSLDILPTLSNLFGVEYDSRLLVGRDVFSDAQPLVLWVNSSWKTEKGSYNASTATFTPAEGVEVDESYVKYISSIVSNKITFSKSVANNDYYNYVVKAMGEE